MIVATAQTDEPAPALSTGPRPAVVPRRPVRPAHDQMRAKSIPRPEWRERSETVSNLFSDLFDTVDEVALAPRTARERGRARIQAMTRAREMAAAPELFNLWHNAIDPEAEPQSPPEAANDAPDPQDHLGRIRAALYAADAPVDAAAAITQRTLARKGQSVQMRLAVHAMNGTLIVVAAPVGAAVLTYSLFRGEDLRLTGHAMAVCGALMTFIQTGLSFV